jgi:hypothetical protein
VKYSNKYAKTDCYGGFWCVCIILMQNGKSDIAYLRLSQWLMLVLFSGFAV